VVTELEQGQAAGWHDLVKLIESKPAELRTFLEKHRTSISRSTWPND